MSKRITFNDSIRLFMRLWLFLLRLLHDKIKFIDNEEQYDKKKRIAE
jgi:hypothetical protein